MTADFLSYLVIGFVAQLVDGTSGMAYGVISTTALLSAGLSPLNVTANIHFANCLRREEAFQLILSDRSFRGLSD